MLHYRSSVAEDVDNIEPNEYFNITKELVKQGFSVISTLKTWTVLDDTRIIAIILANEFYKDFYAIGIVICKDIKTSELIYLKKIVKELVETQGAKYVYSEGETHPVKDRFHEFMGFEIEKDLLGKFKKWKYKGTEV